MRGTIARRRRQLNTERYVAGGARLAQAACDARPEWVARAQPDATRATFPGTMAQPSFPTRSLNVRICHWINLVAVGYLLVSGVHIFLDFPELYWGKTGFRGYPAAFRLEDWGISWEQAGKWGDRRWGRNAHFTFSWLFVLNGLVYVGASLYRRHFRSMLPWRAPRAAATRGGTPEPLVAHHRYRTPQGVAYLTMIFGVTPVMFLTGLAQMPAFTAIAPWLIDLFGGRQTARTIHMLATVVFVAFALVHVGQVIATGFFSNLRGMITGRLRTTGE